MGESVDLAWVICCCYHGWGEGFVVVGALPRMKIGKMVMVMKDDEECVAGHRYYVADVRRSRSWADLTFAAPVAWPIKSELAYRQV